MATNPMGPTFDGGEEIVGVNSDGQRYEILFLPDVKNDDLQREGKPPFFYWVPRAVRIARRGEGGRGGLDGDYKFRLMHFVGVQSGATHVGVSGVRETAGGVISLTTTTAPPLAALESAKQALIKRLQGDSRRFWSLRSNVTPAFAPTPVSASRVSMTNLSPTADGSVPIETPTLPQPGNATIPPAGAAGGPGAPGGAPPGPRGLPAPRMDNGMIHRARGDMVTAVPLSARLDDQMRYERDIGGSALDPWYWGLQGNGPGPLDPAAEHAFSGLLGTLPTAILWQGFRGAYSPISVVQSFLIPVWSTNIELTIRGDWERVFTHFSAAAKGRAWWFSADIKAEFNNLRISGGITVDLLIDGTAPGADKMQEEINKRIDMVTEQFTNMAKQVIFQPAPQVEPAQASDGGGLFGGLFGFGGGLALKYRRDETMVNLYYKERRQFRYNRLHVISSTLEGFFDDLKRDPDAERKYFDTLYLDDWDRKVVRIVKPVVNWPDPSQKWIGDPVAFLSCQVGYPDTRGTVQWAANVFQSTDTGDTTKWMPAFAKKNAADVANPPSGWTPDKAYVKRKVHLTEPPSALENPYNRVFVERNVIDLDEGENGSLNNDNTIEVRADSVGVLEVGPLSLNVALADNTQVVEVEFQASGKTLDGAERPVVRFSFKAEDQDLPRRWKIFTGDPSFLVQYQYRVRVVVKGSIFSKGMEWVGPWNQGLGNGPLMVSVPTPDDPGVTRRALIDEDTTSATGAMPPPPSTASTTVGAGTGGIGAPPATRLAADTGVVSGYTLTEPKVVTTERETAMVPVGPPPAMRKTTRADADGGYGESAGKLELTASFRTRSTNG